MSGEARNDGSLVAVHTSSDITAGYHGGRKLGPLRREHWKAIGHGLLGGDTGRQQFALIHVLRGIAASWVVLFHASEGKHIDQVKANLPEAINTIFHLGDNGVAIFFALSGYVIAHSVGDAEVTPSYLGRFALRRSIRLDPPYWASIAIVVGLAWISASIKSEPFATPGLAQLIAHLTYTQGLLGYAQINTIYWTLCYEVQFYLVLIVALMLARRLRKAAVFVYFVLYVAAVLWGTGVLPNPTPGLFLSHWHCFFLGVLACWAHSSRSALGSLLVLILALFLSAPSAFTVTCALTALGLFIARRSGFITHGGNWRPLMFLGTISYSLYLIHNPVTGGAFYIFERLGISQWISFPATLALCALFAFLMWLCVEWPAIRWARRIKMRPPSAAGFGTGFASVAPLASRGDRPEGGANTNRG